MAKAETAAEKRARIAAEKQAAAEAKAAAEIKDAAENEPPEPVATEEIIEDGYPANIHEAEVMAVRTRSGGSFWRGGLQFGQEWRVLNRSELLNERDWTRIAADPQLEVRGVTLRAAQDATQ
ncbi:hypothetical protein [Snodgrassella sp. CFCC 13594]|uniref:hypothetical protein n=1 Tax=Snodgrassella sp. CFCC 13594 TaxID=1775559 RepID=UPI00082D43F9|nr:hypothetical protein [Snodgrassella sp. CFCC 13594]